MRLVISFRLVGVLVAAVFMAGCTSHQSFHKPITSGAGFEVKQSLIWDPASSQLVPLPDAETAGAIALQSRVTTETIDGTLDPARQVPRAKLVILPSLGARRVTPSSIVEAKPVADLVPVAQALPLERMVASAPLKPIPRQLLAAPLAIAPPQSLIAQIPGRSLSPASSTSGLAAGASGIGDGLVLVFTGRTADGQVVGGQR